MCFFFGIVVTLKIHFWHNFSYFNLKKRKGHFMKMCFTIRNQAILAIDLSRRVNPLCHHSVKYAHMYNK